MKYQHRRQTSRPNPSLQPTCARATDYCLPVLSQAAVMTRKLGRNLLWIDCTAAWVAGVAVLSLNDWLSRLQALPQDLLLFIGATNLLYGCYSFTLAIRSHRPRSSLTILVGANLGWACVCISLGTHFASSATVWGLGHLFGEALFVGGLAGLEWRWRNYLLEETSHAAA